MLTEISDLIKFIYNFALNYFSEEVVGLVFLFGGLLVLLALLMILQGVFDWIDGVGNKDRELTPEEYSFAANVEGDMRYRGQIERGLFYSPCPHLIDGHIVLINNCEPYDKIYIT